MQKLLCTASARILRDLTHLGCMRCHIINSLSNRAAAWLAGAFSNRAAAWPAGAFSSHTARAGLAFAECALGYSAGYAGVVFTECAFGNTPSVHLAIRRACIWQYAERAFGNTPDVHLANTPRVPVWHLPNVH